MTVERFEVIIRCELRGDPDKIGVAAADMLGTGKLRVGNQTAPLPADDTSNEALTSQRLNLVADPQMAIQVQILRLMAEHMMDFPGDSTLLVGPVEVASLGPLEDEDESASE